MQRPEQDRIVPSGGSVEGGRSLPDRMVRALLCEAANVLVTPVQRRSWLKRWGVEVACRRGKVRAQVAVARRLAVIMHRMWIGGAPFRWTRDAVDRVAPA